MQITSNIPPRPTSPGKVTGNDKPKKTTESGGLSAKALWDSQAERRAEEKAAAAAEKAKRRAMPTGPAAMTDGSDAALRTLQDTVKFVAEARKRDEARAAERAQAARREEQARAAKPESGQEADPFRPDWNAEADPFRPDWNAEPEAPTELRTLEVASREPSPPEPGSLLDTYA